MSSAQNLPSRLPRRYRKESLTRPDVKEASSDRQRFRPPAAFAPLAAGPVGTTLSVASRILQCSPHKIAGNVIHRGTKCVPLVGQWADKDKPSGLTPKCRTVTTDLNDSMLIGPAENASTIQYRGVNHAVPRATVTLSPPRGYFHFIYTSLRRSTSCPGDPPRAPPEPSDRQKAQCADPTIVFTGTPRSLIPQFPTMDSGRSYR